MDDRQENKLSMFYTVMRVVDNNAAVWAEDGAFSSSYGVFKQKISALEVRRNAQMERKTGVALEKKNKRQELIGRLCLLVSRIQSMAVASGNVELRANIRYTMTDFVKRRDTDLVGLAQNVLAAGRANLVELGPYQVTVVSLDGLENMIVDYNDSIALPRIARVAVKVATADLGMLMDEASEVLKERMDKNMVLYQFSDPDFYGVYKSARRIIGHGGSRLSMLGMVKNADGAAVVGAKIFVWSVLENGERKLVLKKKSADKGRFYVKSLPSGRYEVEVVKLGFSDVMVEVDVVKGEMGRVEVLLC